MYPLVSVVIPVYNVEKYLDRCVQSVVNQTYRNLEILLIDDGSPDGCPGICDQWAKKDNRIKVIHKQNEGLGMARNSGLDIATGEYICFFDSDDYVDKSIVEKCIANAEKYGSDAVIYGRYDVYDDGRCIKKDINSSKEIFVSQEVTDELLPAMFTYDMGVGISAWGKMFSLEVFRKYNLRFVSEKEIISEDSFFALEFFSHATAVSVVNECLYYYYKRENSLSRSFRVDRHMRNDEFLQKSVSYATTANLPPKVITHVSVRYHMYTISAMKQLISSELSGKEKNRLLKEMLRSPVLHSSISFETLKIHKKNLFLFFVLMKIRCYPLCKALLKFKSKIS